MARDFSSRMMSVWRKVRWFEDNIGYEPENLIDSFFQYSWVNHYYDEEVEPRGSSILYPERKFVDDDCVLDLRTKSILLDFPLRFLDFPLRDSGVAKIKGSLLEPAKQSHQLITVMGKDPVNCVSCHRPHYLPDDDKNVCAACRHRVYREHIHRTEPTPRRKSEREPQMVQLNPIILQMEERLQEIDRTYIGDRAALTERRNQLRAELAEVERKLQRAYSMPEGVKKERSDILKMLAAVGIEPGESTPSEEELEEQAPPKSPAEAIARVVQHIEPHLEEENDAAAMARRLAAQHAEEITPAVSAEERATAAREAIQDRQAADSGERPPGDISTATKPPKPKHEKATQAAVRRNQEKSQNEMDALWPLAERLGIFNSTKFLEELEKSTGKKLPRGTFQNYITAWAEKGKVERHGGQRGPGVFWTTKGYAGEKNIRLARTEAMQQKMSQSGQTLTRSDTKPPKQSAAGRPSVDQTKELETKVRDWLQLQKDTPFGLREMADDLGVSQQTAQRHLNLAVEAGRVKLHQLFDRSKKGSPTNRTLWRYVKPNEAGKAAETDAKAKKQMAAPVSGTSAPVSGTGKQFMPSNPDLKALVTTIRRAGGRVEAPASGGHIPVFIPQPDGGEKRVILASTPGGNVARSVMNMKTRLRRAGLDI